MISASIKSVWSLRSKSHIDTRFALRDERVHAYTLFPWFAMIMIGFSVVDYYICNQQGLLKFMAIRAAGVSISKILFLLSRGRARYGYRLFMTVFPFLAVVQWIMVSENLLMTPYFAGSTLVIVTSAMLFPVRTSVALYVYALCYVPFIIWLGLDEHMTFIYKIVSLLMSVGTILLCGMLSGVIRDDQRARIFASENLRRTLGTREEEIRMKAQELNRRMMFESQFSPQVVHAVLRSPASVATMKQADIATIVFDIESSTSKANSLPPEQYKLVVEEIFDLFSAACLKWNVTVDKFTGDGAQAFAGAPVATEDQLFRAVKACQETIKHVYARKHALEVDWGGTLNIRFAVVEGEGLVGFLGRGNLKSYTAIGSNVSLAHRICGVGGVWHVAILARQPHKLFPLFDDVPLTERHVKGLKGFGEKMFTIIEIAPPAEHEATGLDFGRCQVCGTPMTMNETRHGLPKIECPSCLMRKAA